MPIAGFKQGDAVLTPSGQPATVIRATRVQGRERVTVRYDRGPYDHRRFDAAALRHADRSST